jgi:hypothetical protein
MLTSCQMFEFLIPIGARNIRPIEREGMDPEHSGRGATSDAYGCTGRVDDALGLATKDSTLRLYALEHPMRCCRRRLDHKLVLIKTNKPTSTLPAKELHSVVHRAAAHPLPHPVGQVAGPAVSRGANK